MNSADRDEYRARAEAARERARNASIGPVSLKGYMNYSPGRDIDMLANDVWRLAGALEALEGEIRTRAEKSGERTKTPITSKATEVELGALRAYEEVLELLSTPYTPTDEGPPQARSS